MAYFICCKMYCLLKRNHFERHCSGRYLFMVILRYCHDHDRTTPHHTVGHNNRVKAEKLTELITLGLAQTIHVHHKVSYTYSERGRQKENVPYIYIYIRCNAKRAHMATIWSGFYFFMFLLRFTRTIGCT